MDRNSEVDLPILLAYYITIRTLCIYVSKVRCNICSRRECEKLRKEITSQKDEERRAEMDRLSELKDEQMQAAKQGWETKLKQLLDEVSLEIQLVKMLNYGQNVFIVFHV